MTALLLPMGVLLSVAMIGMAAAPTTEKHPLMPQAQTNMCSLPRRTSQPMPVAMGNPMRKAGGATTPMESTSRSG